MKKRIGKFILVILLSFSFTLSGCSLSGCAPGGQEQGPSQPLTLTWWGPTKDADYFSTVIEKYEDKYSNIKINFVKKDFATYETDLIDAIAANQGPDIAMFHSDWFYKHSGKISPLELSDESSQSFEDNFLPIVSNVVLHDKKLYGVPLEVNTLGLYYNEDIFGEARVRRPPSTWTEFNQIVRQLTKRNGDRITQAGAAIGTNDNISTAEDILLTMMLQNGTEISSSDWKSATFHTAVQSADNQPVYTGRKALEYYTSFSNPRRDAYTWNRNKNDAWIEFANGKVGMIFDYQFRQSDIYNRNPQLDFEFSRVPQIKNSTPDEQAVYGNFWFHGITNNTQNHQWAWNFVQFLAHDKATTSLKKTAKRYEEAQYRDEIFAGQGLIAETVYKGRYPTDFDQAFFTMIHNVATNKQDIRTAIDSAAAKVTSVYRNSQ
jgi:multiple sugar transport system substrate-binding protein